VLGLGGAGSLGGCYKTAPEKAVRIEPGGDAIKRSFDGLKSQLAALEASFSALRQQVEAIPPDLPGFPEVRARFYAIEESRGITDARVMLLSGRLESALTTGKPEELSQVSKEIAETLDDVRHIDQLHVALLHQVLAFQRLALREQEAKVRRSKSER
jgi:hypothetical protein